MTSSAYMNKFVGSVNKHITISKSQVGNVYKGFTPSLYISNRVYKKKQRTSSSFQLKTNRTGVLIVIYPTYNFLVIHKDETLELFTNRK